MSQPLNRFNWIAPYYDRLTRLVFGNAIREAHTCHLNLIPANSSVLVLGGGTGKWLCEFMKSNCNCRIWYVDSSSKMLEQAKENLGSEGRIEFIHGTEKDIPEMQFDVLITHFYLDMFADHQLGALASRIKNLFHKNSIWLASDFERSSFWHTSFLVVMYLIFRISNTINTRRLPNWNKVLSSYFTQSGDSTSLYGRFIQCRVYQNGESSGLSDV